MLTTPIHPQAILPLECDRCKQTNQRQISLMSPKLFCNPRDATMLIQYRCIHCQAPQAFRILFKEKDGVITATAKHRVDVQALLIPPTSTGITVRPRQKSHR